MNEKSKATYQCINRRCRRYHQPFVSLPPAEWRRLTGHSVSCDVCGQVARFVQFGEQEPQKLNGV